MKKLFTLFCLTLVATLSGQVWGNGDSKTYYSKVDVSVATGEGKVYVSSDAVDETCGQSATQSGTSKSHSYNLLAVPGVGFEFTSWNDGNTENPRTVSVDANSETENSPTVTKYQANFGEAMKVMVMANSDLGTVTIDKPDNTIGDVVTITAAPVKASTNTEYWSTVRPSSSITFDGWYNPSGEKVSDELKYKFTVEECGTYTARFSREYTLKVDEKKKIYGYYRLQSALCSNPDKNHDDIAKYFVCMTGNFKLSINAYRGTDVSGAVSLNQTPYHFNGVKSSEYGYSQAPYSDCGSILYIAGDALDNIYTSPKSRTIVAKNVTAEAQGVKISDLIGTSYSLSLETANTPGFYIITAGSNLILRSHYFLHLRIGADEANSLAMGHLGDMDIQPVDLEHIDTNYFGAYPSENMEYDGGYWQTHYTSFPYECYEEDGLEAYVVKAAKSNSDGTYVVLTRLEDGIVPPATPVILKCKGLLPKENRMIPLMPDDERIAAAKEQCEGNLLTGNYGLWTGCSSTDNVVNTGRPTLDQATMRVFSVNTNGDIGFYRIAMNSDGSAPEMVPNRAYLTDKALTDAGISPSAVARGAVKMRIEDGWSGIEDVVVDDSETSVVKGTYDLYGRKVDQMIPGNIYIVNGKKILYR